MYITAVKPENNWNQNKFCRNRWGGIEVMQERKGTALETEIKSVGTREYRWNFSNVHAENSKHNYNECLIINRPASDGKLCSTAATEANSWVWTDDEQIWPSADDCRRMFVTRSRVESVNFRADISLHMAQDTPYMSPQQSFYVLHSVTVLACTPIEELEDSAGVILPACPCWEQLAHLNYGQKLASSEWLQQCSSWAS